MAKKIVVIAFALLLAAACGHRLPNHILTYAPDGREGWMTSCHGWGQTIGHCIQSARIVCNGDFEEIARHEEIVQRGSLWKMGSTGVPMRRLEYICKHQPGDGQ